MLEAIITLLISMNLQFTVIDDQSLSMPSGSSTVLKSGGPEKIDQDLIIIKGENGQDDIVIVPDVDPAE